jgi:hypothetical protein
MKLLTINQYATLRGVSLAAVQKAIASGRIKPVFDHNNNVRIDPISADKAWEENTQLHLNVSGLASDLQREVYNERNENSNEEHLNSKGPDDALTYTEARTQREIYEAKLVQLEYEHRISKMIIAEDLKAGVYTAVKLTREALLNLPNRLSSQLSLETDSSKIHTLLTTEIHQALEELARANC